MDLVGTWLGENFDAPIAQLVVVRGEWILIDSNFANGRLGRQLPARKSVNKDLSPIRTRSWTGERSQFVLQLVGIVGKRIEIFALDHDGAGIAFRTGAHTLRVRCHFDLLLVHR